MKAWILHGVNDIRLEETEQPYAGKNEVLIAVKACGICGSDITRIYSTGAHKMPLIPGHEFAGTVIQAGAGVDKSWIGKRVGVFPLIPCKTCRACIQKKYELCSHYNYLGSRCNGGFAEYVAVPVWNLIELPDHIAYEAAAMLEPMAVAVHALRRVTFKASETVLIYGAGTIGMLLAMFLLSHKQSNVFVIGNKPFQREMLMKMGLPVACFCDGTVTDAATWVQTQTQGQGADVVFECIGKNDTISQSFGYIRPEGQICLVGNPHADVYLDKNTYWSILRKEITVTGTWNSSFKAAAQDDWSDGLQELLSGTMCPQKLVTHTFPIERLEEGLHIMRDKTQPYVKIMMKVNNPE